MKQYVIYKRVSTQEQKRSGLGLEAQTRDIELFLASYSETPWEVIGEFEDTGSGADDDRPALQAALKLVRANKGSELLVSKLDRLSRRMLTIATLLEDKQVRFRVASMPNADVFQLHIYAALAEQEREFISRRTKAALASAKARGVKLGGFREGALEASHAVSIARADKFAQDVGPTVLAFRAQGKSPSQIAAELERAGWPRPQGGRWSDMAVRRLLKRIEPEQVAA